MLFFFFEFEHEIEETKLEKGLKLFIHNKLELTDKTENKFTFLIIDKNQGEISIQIKAGKILSYSCFCNAKNYCEMIISKISQWRESIQKEE